MHNDFEAQRQTKLKDFFSVTRWTVQDDGVSGGALVMVNSTFPGRAPALATEVRVNLSI